METKILQMCAINVTSVCDKYNLSNKKYMVYIISVQVICTN